MRFARWSRILVIAACVISARLAPAQGAYNPVTGPDLAGADFNHYFNDNKKVVTPPDFSWTFSATDLVIKAGKGLLPADLTRQLAAGRKDVKTIEATWKVENGSLLISVTAIDGNPASGEASFRAYRTAPTVIRIGEQQYVFVPKR